MAGRVTEGQHPAKRQRLSPTSGDTLIPSHLLHDLARREFPSTAALRGPTCQRVDEDRASLLMPGGSASSGVAVGQQACKSAYCVRAGLLLSTSMPSRFSLASHTATLHPRLLKSRLFGEPPLLPQSFPPLCPENSSQAPSSCHHPHMASGKVLSSHGPEWRQHCLGSASILSTAVRPAAAAACALPAQPAAAELPPPAALTSPASRVSLPRQQSSTERGLVACWRECDLPSLVPCSNQKQASSTRAETQAVREVVGGTLSSAAPFTMPWSATSHSLPSSATSFSLPSSATSHSLPSSATSFSLPSSTTSCTLPSVEEVKAAAAGLEALHYGVNQPRAATKKRRRSLRGSRGPARTAPPSVSLGAKAAGVEALLGSSSLRSDAKAAGSALASSDAAFARQKHPAPLVQQMSSQSRSEGRSVPSGLPFKVCGQRFAKPQALGGHMKWHRSGGCVWVVRASLWAGLRKGR